MTVAIYANVTDARQGGGLTYVLAIAAALAAVREVRVLFPVEMDMDLVRRLLPVPLDGLRLGTAARPRSLAGELRSALLGTDEEVLVQSTEVPRLRGLRNAHLICEFPFQRALRPAERVRLALFRSVIANSAYTARWIERRWGRAARVLHPPVFGIAPRAKKPWIVALGRFAGGGRSKRQVEMIELFAGLVRGGLEGWELHLVGTVQDQDYFGRARDAARGLPVVFHADAPREELEEVCGASSLFWHFAGLGADPEAEPEKMEHFGIATAEAMSAGAVPVVVARGGQPEIVGDDGFLFETLEQCADATRRLCAGEALRADLCARARRRAESFAFPVFAERARELFAPARS